MGMSSKHRMWTALNRPFVYGFFLLFAAAAAMWSLFPSKKPTLPAPLFPSIPESGQVVTIIDDYLACDESDVLWHGQVGGKAISLTQRGYLYTWDIATRTRLSKVEVHKGWINRVFSMGEGRFIFNDESGGVWHLTLEGPASRYEVGEVRHHYVDMAFDPVRKRVLLLAETGVVHWFDPATDAVTTIELPLPAESENLHPARIAYSPQTERFAVVYFESDEEDDVSDDRARLDIRTSSGELLDRFKDKRLFEIQGGLMLFGGKVASKSSHGFEIGVYDMSLRKVVASRSMDEPPKFASFSEAGRSVAMYHADGRVSYWNFAGTGGFIQRRTDWVYPHSMFDAPMLVDAGRISAAGSQVTILGYAPHPLTLDVSKEEAIESSLAGRIVYARRFRAWNGGLLIGTSNALDFFPLTGDRLSPMAGRSAFSGAWRVARGDRRATAAESGGRWVAEDGPSAKSENELVAKHRLFTVNPAGTRLFAVHPDDRIDEFEIGETLQLKSSTPMPQNFLVQWLAATDRALFLFGYEKTVKPVPEYVDKETGLRFRKAPEVFHNPIQIAAYDIAGPGPRFIGKTQTDLDIESNQPIGSRHTGLKSYFVGGSRFGHDLHTVEIDDAGVIKIQSIQRFIPDSFSMRRTRWTLLRNRQQDFLGFGREDGSILIVNPRNWATVLDRKVLNCQVHAMDYDESSGLLFVSGVNHSLVALRLSDELK